MKTKSHILILTGFRRFFTLGLDHYDFHSIVVNGALI